MNPVAEDILMHYGVKRRSGRYPWGSGKNPYQHSGDFLSRVKELEDKGYSEKQIAEDFEIPISELRLQKRVAGHERRALDVDRARSLKEDGLTPTEIGRIMGRNESSIRSLLNEDTSVHKNRAQVTADILMKEMDEKGMLDVGRGVCNELGCSQGVLEEALFILQTKGYEVYNVGIPQATQPKRQSNTSVLCMPGTEHKDVYADMGKIQPVGNYHSIDGGTTYKKLQYPASIDSSRVHIKYGDKGGIDKDGVIEIRRGVADLDLGNSHYAQVRILVDGTHYLKGMAMYSDDMPPGADIIFNTNKPSGTPKEKVFKEIKEDAHNPFGAYIKANGQSMYIGKDGKEHLSAINKLKEEGDWDKMSRNLSSQFLSKQPMSLINRQLKLSYADKIAEYNDICALDNPTVKKKLLLDFAEDCDSAAVHLKAAALPRQSTQVILPCTHLKDTEVYAPNYKNGEKIALVRYPHGGTFEIPELTVNNRNVKAKAIFGNMTDAIGIHPNVAAQLSGADFDGDTVIAIPTNDRVKIKTSRPLKELEGFDPKTEYAIPEGNPNKAKIMSEDYKQKQMGIVSNLITDMTLKGAPPDEIARAVKHSMVVIDAAKHKLDYKKSERDQGIAELKQKWQGYTADDGSHVGGASTLLSRRKQDVWVDERKGSGVIDPETGKVSYKTTGRTYIDKKTGEVVKAQTKAKLLKETDDIRTLSSGTNKENAYADYANQMKALANQARKEYKTTGNLVYSSDAKTKYKAEVDTLNSKLNTALKNAPKERRANAIVNSKVKAMIQDNPELANDKDMLKKIKNTYIQEARASVGADSKGTKIIITDKEWEAIQSGAITDSKLKQILDKSDMDRVRELATPKTATQLSSLKIAKLKNMAASGSYTNYEMAEALGVSPSTISKYLNG